VLLDAYPCAANSRSIEDCSAKPLVMFGRRLGELPPSAIFVPKATVLCFFYLTMVPRRTRVPCKAIFFYIIIVVLTEADSPSNSSKLSIGLRLLLCEASAPGLCKSLINGLTNMPDASWALLEDSARIFN